MGFTVIAGNGYSGTIAAAYGANLKYSCTSAAAKTTNLYLSNAAVTSNSGTITNTYGYYCGDITAGTQTNTPYSFYALDSGAYNYFAGKTAIGTITTPSAYIHSTGSTEQLRIGYDVSNYWSATVSSAGVLALTGTGTGMTLGKLLAAPAAAPTVASGSTIAPTTQIAFVSGTTTIGTITAPAPISAGGGQITLIPTGLWSTSTSGNIALATTAVISKALIMTYDSTTTKWYPSY